MNQYETALVRHALELLNEARRERELKSLYAMELEAEAREILARLLAAQESDKDRLR
jgi:ATP-dependent protease HslVU (ClpYQ) peptidase subunit